MDKVNVLKELNQNHRGMRLPSSNFSSPDSIGSEKKLHLGDRSSVTVSPISSVEQENFHEKTFEEKLVKNLDYTFDQSMIKHLSLGDREKSANNSLVTEDISHCYSSNEELYHDCNETKSENASDTFSDPTTTPSPTPIVVNNQLNETQELTTAQNQPPMHDGGGVPLTNDEINAQIEKDVKQIVDDIIDNIVEKSQETTAEAPSDIIESDANVGSVNENPCDQTFDSRSATQLNETVNLKNISDDISTEVPQTNQTFVEDENHSVYNISNNSQNKINESQIVVPSGDHTFVENSTDNGVIETTNMMNMTVDMMNESPVEQISESLSNQNITEEQCDGGVSSTTFLSGTYVEPMDVDDSFVEQSTNPHNETVDIISQSANPHNETIDIIPQSTTSHNQTVDIIPSEAESKLVSPVLKKLSVEDAITLSSDSLDTNNEQFEIDSLNTSTGTLDNEVVTERNPITTLEPDNPLDCNNSVSEITSPTFSGDSCEDNEKNHQISLEIAEQEFFGNGVRDHVHSQEIGSADNDMFKMPSQPMGAMGFEVGSVKNEFSNFGGNDFSDEEFRPATEGLLNPSDFDFELLSSHGNKTSQPVRDSILLRFDPLLSKVTPVNQSPVAPVSRTVSTNPQSNQQIFTLPNEAACGDSNRKTIGGNKRKSTAVKVFEETKPNCEQHPTQDFINFSLGQGVRCVKVAGDDKMSLDMINMENHENIKQFEHHNNSTGQTKNEHSKMENDGVAEKKLKDPDMREEALLKRLTEKEKLITKMSGVMEAYEKTIAELVSENEQKCQGYERKCGDLKNNADLNSQHLLSLEGTFTDFLAKYERSKQLTITLTETVESLRAENTKLHNSLETQEQRYQKMKNHAMGQLEIANEKLDSLSKSHTQEMAKLKAIIKKDEISRNSLQEQLEQKTRENTELVQICDELIGGSGSS